MKKPPAEYVITTPDDGLFAPEVGPWAVEKYQRVGMYAEIFSTGMKNHWPGRVYIDLFSGAGHAIIRDSKQRVLTSPLLALRVRDPFSKYIFCDADEKCLSALRSRVDRSPLRDRVSFVSGDANQRVSNIASEIPVHSVSHRVLSFCFADPFGLDIHFDTVKALGANRAMDFLLLLALSMDANRNWQTYLKPENQKVERFLGSPTWRDRWAAAERVNETPIRFLAKEYAHAMSSLGYLTKSIDEMCEVRTYDNNMRLYYLAFFSKHEKGYTFWREVRKYATPQLGLGF